MPSISKAQLDEMNATIAELQSQLNTERQTKAILASRTSSFNNILDKIGRAARGVPITDEPDAMRNYGGVAYGPDTGHRCEPPNEMEVLRYRVERLTETTTELERRLAAVSAITAFAHDHKG